MTPPISIARTPMRKAPNISTPETDTIDPKDLFGPHRHYQIRALSAAHGRRRARQAQKLEYLVELLKQGFTHRDAARRSGVSSPAQWKVFPLIRKVAADLNIPLLCRCGKPSGHYKGCRGNGRPSPRRIAKIKKQLRAGYNCREISRRLHASRKIVAQTWKSIDPHKRFKCRCGRPLGHGGACAGVRIRRRQLQVQRIIDLYQILANREISCHLRAPRTVVDRTWKREPQKRFKPLRGQQRSIDLYQIFANREILRRLQTSAL